MKPLSEEVKSEIRQLASAMLDVTTRACDECRVTSKAEVDLVSSMIAVELQTELVNHLKAGESRTSVLENRESTASLVDGIARSDTMERVQKLASYLDKGAAYEPFPEGYRNALKDCAKELREAFEK